MSDDLPTISPEAQAFLDQTNASSQPPLRMRPWLVRRARQRLALDAAPVIADIDSRLMADVSPTETDGVPVVSIAPASAVSGSPDYAIYVHGGAFMFGSAKDALGMLMADALGLEVVSLEYPLSPEEAYPAALESCVRAYENITGSLGAPCALVGASTGATLVLAMMQRIRERGLVQPAGIALISPCVDLHPGGDSRMANAVRDPVARWRNQYDKAFASYARYAEVENPLVSPINADFTGDYPPVIITTGTRDLFMSDSVRLASQMRRAGQQPELRVYEGMWHAFLDQPDIPEAAECRQEVAHFLNEALIANVAGERPTTART